MKKRLFLLCAVLAVIGLAGSVYAQDARRGGGARGGAQWGEVEEGIWLKPGPNGVPTLYDTHTGMMMYEDENGKMITRSYRDGRGGKGGGRQAGKKGGGKASSAKKTEERGKAAGKETDAEQKTRLDPAMFWDARALQYREMLECTDEEWKQVILPLLKAVLIKQDEIRRSTTSPGRLQTTTRVSWGGKRNAGSGDLPSAIRTFHSRLRQEKVGPEELKSGLTGFRSARSKQDAELKELRDKLRAVLTILQEARLTAVGVLD